MASTHTLTGNVYDLTGATLGATGVRVTVVTNLPAKSALIDKTTNSIHLGGKHADLDPSTGGFSIDLIDTSATDLNAMANTVQYEVRAEYVNPATRVRSTWTSGWFPFTADANLADITTDVEPLAVESASTYAAAAAASAAEAEAISGLTGEDAAVAFLVEDSGSATAGALSATYVPADKTAINVLQAGASPAKTATENTTILNAVLTQAATEGRAVYFPATDLPIQINDALIVAGPGLTVYGDGPGTVAVQQTAWPKPFLDASTHDNVSVTGIKAINTAPRVSVMTAFRGNTLKNYSAFLYSNADNTTLRNCASDGFNAGFFNLGTSAARLSGAVVDGFEFRDGEFGVFCDYIDGVQIRNVWGDYSYSSGGSQVPHLLYVGAFTDSNITDLTVENLRAFNSPDGSPFQFKGLVGGVIRNLYADGCNGSVTMMAMTDTLIDGVTSVNDVYPAVGTEGSFCTVSTDQMTRVRIANVNIELANDARAIRFLNGDQCSLDNATVRVAHTSAHIGDNSDIEIRGGWTLTRPRVVNTGATGWNAITLYNGAGGIVRDPETTGARIPVRIRDSASAARVYYDTAKLGLHGTDGLQPLDIGSTATTNLAIPNPSPTSSFGRRNLLYANFDAASGSGEAPGTVNTGQAAVLAAGTWIVENGYVRKTNAVVGLLYWEVSQADVEVSCDVIYRDANGIAFRVNDSANYLHARIRFDGVHLFKRVAGADASLAVSAAMTPVNDRRFRLKVRVFGALVKVFLDDELVITHTLSGGDETTFGSGTKHGLRGHTDVAAKWTDLRIDSLR